MKRLEKLRPAPSAAALARQTLTDRGPKGVG